MAINTEFLIESLFGGVTVLETHSKTVAMRSFRRLSNSKYYLSFLQIKGISNFFFVFPSFYQPFLPLLSLAA